tara:strand:+ start:389 stop:1102 length:714 start_codon:yes stop_codon:yes gene_type:complete
MKLTILTTQTVHHTFFVKELIKIGIEVNVFLESNNQKPFPFQTFHDFEKERDIYEIEKWFSGKNTKIEDIAKTKKFKSINSLDAINLIKGEETNISIVFGTGKINENFINSYRGTILNLHGGDPEYYRGLDSHLWAIYHKDFNKITTTIHKLDEKLDNGEIIFKKEVPITKNSSLKTLRSENTELCVDLVKKAIKMFEDNSFFISTKQKQIGRYYSAMPAVLKSIALKNFSNYIKSF